MKICKNCEYYQDETHTPTGKGIAYCYKKERCLEREQFGRCSKYRSIGSIKAEIEAVMQSAKSSESVSAEDGRIRQDEGVNGNQEATERVFLASEVQEADKDKEEGLEDGWYSYFRHSTVNAVVRGRHTVHLARDGQAGCHAGAETGTEGNHSR